MEGRTRRSRPVRAGARQRTHPRDGQLQQSGPGDLLALQRSVGNRVVTKLVSSPVPGTPVPTIYRAFATAWVKEPALPLFSYKWRTHGKQPKVLPKKQAHLKRRLNLKQGDKVLADETPEYYAPTASEPEYTRVKDPRDGVVAISGLQSKKPKSDAGWDKAETTGGALGEAASVLDLRAGATDRGSDLREQQGDYKVDKADNAGTDAWQQKHGADVASGSAEVISNIINIAATIRAWKSRKKSEKVSDAFDIGATTLSTGAAITKMIDSGAKTQSGTSGGFGGSTSISGGSGPATAGGSYDTTVSDAAGKIMGNIADFGSLIKDAKDIFFTFKEAWSTWSKATSSRGDLVRTGAAAGLAFMNMVKSSLTTARNLLFTLENAWHAGLSAAVPGIGIAITALQACLNAVKLVKAEKMRRKLKEHKHKYRDKWGDATKDITKRADAKVHEMISGQLQTISGKRVKRQVLNLTTQFMSIAGDIATLSGVGASAGVALKAASSGTQLGAKGLRAAKQFGRNRAAKDSSWNVTKKVFNAGKSTAKKKEARESLANAIYDRITVLAGKIGDIKLLKDVDKADQKELDRVQLYVRASGLSFKQWCRQMYEDPDKGHSMLLKALAERE